MAKIVLNDRDVLSALGDEYDWVFAVEPDSDSFTLLMHISKHYVFLGIDKFSVFISTLRDRLKPCSYVDYDKFMDLSRIKGIDGTNDDMSIFSLLVSSKMHELEIAIHPISYENGHLKRFLFTVAELSSVLRQKDVNHQYFVQQAFKSERLVNEAFKDFTTLYSFDESVLHMLRSIGEFYKAERVIFYEIKGDFAFVKNEWDSSNITPMKSLYPLLDASLFDFAEKAFKEHSYLHVHDIKDLKDKFPASYQRISAKGIRNFVWAPVYVDEKLIGFIDLDNPAPESIGNIGTIVLDISGRFAYAIKVNKTQELLNKDQLTGLPTPQMMNYLLNEMVNKPPHSSYVVVKFALSGFKLIESFFGSVRSDGLIKAVASSIKDNLPHVLLLSHSPKSGTFYYLVDDDPKLVGSHFASWASAFANAHLEAHVSFVAGALSLDDLMDKSFESIESRLSLAYSSSEKLAKPVLILYNEGIGKRMRWEREVVDTFPEALERGEFLVYFQPKYDVRIEAYYGAEALVRWNHNGRIVPPNDFIPILERNGLVSRLDAYVLSYVLKTLRDFIDRGHAVIPISINISRIDFYEVGIFERIMDLIDGFHIPHELIELEITESAFIASEAPIVSFLAKCRKASICVSMDDFGSGYSSLNSLKELDISFLKLDYRFLSASPNIDKRNAIIISIVSLCKFLSLEVVIEGVEKGEDYRFLRQLGVKCFQGYFFSKPMPVDMFSRLNFHYKPRHASTRSIPVLSSIFDPTNPTNFVFENSLDPMGAFSLTSRGLMMILENRALTSFASSGDFPLFNGNDDFFSLLSEGEAAHLREYLDNSKEGKERRKSISVRFAFKDRSEAVEMKVTYFVGQEDIDYFLFSFKAGATFASKDNSLSEAEAEKIVNALPSPSVLFDPSRTAIAINEAMKREIGMKLSPGEKCNQLVCPNGEDCDNCPLFFSGSSQRCFSRRTNSFLDLATSHINVDGKDCTLFSAKRSSIALDVDFGRFLRFGDVLEDAFLAYFEIDLASGAYDSMVFSSHIGPFPSKGSSFEEIEGLLFKVLGGMSKEKAENNLTLAALRKKSQIPQPYNVRIFNSRSKIWVNARVAFFDNNGNKMVSLSFVDVNKDTKKDYDSLTKVLNRSAGEYAINNFFVASPSKRMAFILFDIDNFKMINDTYGHPFGDQVLVKICENLRQSPLGFRFVTRLGGDEFVFLLPLDPEEDDYSVIIGAISEAAVKVGEDLNLPFLTTVSTGLSVFPEQGTTFNTLYSASDKAMYMEKRSKKVARRQIKYGD